MHNQILTVRLKESGITADLGVNVALEVCEGKMYEQQSKEILKFEKNEELRDLRKRYEAQYQQIEILEKQKAELSEQAKNFEMNYRLQLHHLKLRFKI